MKKFLLLVITVRILYCFGYRLVGQESPVGIRYKVGEDAEKIRNFIPGVSLDELISKN